MPLTTSVFYSIFPTDPDDLAYLTGILNSDACNFVSRHLARPKDNGCYDIETQFLAPLPVPAANASDKAVVSNCADSLETLVARRSELQGDIFKRLQACSVEQMREEWVWPASVLALDQLRAMAPAELKGRYRTAWVRTERQSRIQEQLDIVADRPRPGMHLSASIQKGELKITSELGLVLDDIFVKKGFEQVAAAAGRYQLRQNENLDAIGLVGVLRKFYSSSSAAIGEQLAELDASAQETEAALAAASENLNSICNRLYGLTPDEVRLIQPRRALMASEAA